MLKEKYFCSFFITSLRLCTHYFVWTPVSNLPLKTILSIHYQIKTEGNRNILPVPISLHNNTCTYPKVKPKWLSSYTSINPFTRCMQTLFSRASHPTANAVLSTLRFNFLASSGIDILFTSLRMCHTLPALTPTILLSIRLTFKYLYSIDNNPTNIPWWKDTKDNRFPKRKSLSDDT